MVFVYLRGGGVKGVKGVKEVKEVKTTALLFEFPCCKNSKCTASTKQPISDSCPCGRIPQNAALLLAKTSDGPPTIE